MMKQSLLIEVKHSNELKNSMPVAHMFKKEGLFPLDQEQVMWVCKQEAFGENSPRQFVAGKLTPTKTAVDKNR